MMMNSMRKIKRPHRVIVRIVKMMGNHLILCKIKPQMELKLLKLQPQKKLRNKVKPKPNSAPQRVKPKLQSKHKQELRKLRLLKQKQKGSEQEVTREQETDMCSQMSVLRKFYWHPRESCSEN